MKIGKSIVHFGAALIMTLFIAFPSTTQAFDDSVSLHGIETGKAYFSIDTTNLAPERLPMLLMGVAVTHDMLVEQGVSPDLIVGFWGTNLTWLTNSADPMVKSLVQQLDALGVRLEICYAAMNIFGVSPESVLPEIEIVGSVWISQIAYGSKSKGYAIIDF